MIELIAAVVWIALVSAVVAFMVRRRQNHEGLSRAMRRADNSAFMRSMRRAADCDKLRVKFHMAH